MRTWVGPVGTCFGCCRVFVPIVIPVSEAPHCLLTPSSVQLRVLLATLTRCGVFARMQRHWQRPRVCHPLVAKTPCPGGTSISTHRTDKETEAQGSKAVCPRNTQKADSPPAPSLKSQILRLASHGLICPGMSGSSVAPAGVPMCHQQPCCCLSPLPERHTLRCHPNKGTVVRKD